LRLDADAASGQKKAFQPGTTSDSIAIQGEALIAQDGVTKTIGAFN
jgi:hypothetical protein